jgi:hypothetical protein
MYRRQKEDVHSGLSAAKCQKLGMRGQKTADSSKQPATRNQQPVARSETKDLS